MPDAAPPDLVPGPDGRPRCFWAADEALRAYHDEEWGFPVADDRGLFERLCLEGFQSGLSWKTVLLKRPAFRKGFAGFEPAKVARFKPAKVEALLQDAGIIRHRGKIESTINNAARALELVREAGSLAAHFARFAPPRRAALRSRGDMVATCPESVALSKDLKKRGWSFVGPTTVYSLMQAVGMVNDHLAGCVAREAAERATR